MGLGPRLELRQSQQLVMTPQLQLAIKLLTLTNVELEGWIAEELERNPLLAAFASAALTAARSATNHAHRPWRSHTFDPIAPHVHRLLDMAP